jgi:nucleotidyltransferase substrate binding protein (TIGR01987 family)
MTDIPPNVNLAASGAKLDISSLLRATAAFERALIYADRVAGKAQNDLDEEEVAIVREAVIQRFEYCYELSWKSMKRYIEMDIGTEADRLSRKDIFRQALSRGLISEYDNWVIYHEARNMTSHIYEEKVALQVYGVARMFAEDLRNFAIEMASRTEVSFK